MFTCDRLPDYKANLDDILHVGNASDAAPDSFVAQENFLSQLENENKKIGKANGDDLLVALDQSLYKIYKGNVTDWEPLASPFDAATFEQTSLPSSLELADIPPYVDASISILASSSDSPSVSENCCHQTNVPKQSKATSNTKAEIRRKRGAYRKRQKKNGAPAKNTKKAEATVVSSSANAVLHSCTNVTNSFNVKPIQVATVCSSTAVSNHAERNQDGIVAPDADSLLDLLEESSLVAKKYIDDEESTVSSSTDKYKRRGATLNESLCAKKQKQAYGDASQAFNAAEDEREVEERHLLDHNYCMLVTVSEQNSAVESQTETVENSMEVAPSKPPQACKILKWQDYLQRVRLGVRSAPNSPTTSPKIPRGAARKVNNFMVMDGTDGNVKFIMPVPPPAPKPPSPLLDPLTAVKVQTKAKTSIRLQEFEEYLAHLETKKKTFTNDSGSEATGSVSSASPSSTLTASPLSQVQTISSCDVLADDSLSPGNTSSRRTVTVQISPDSSTNVIPAGESSKVSCSEKPSAKEQTRTTVAAPDPRISNKSKSKHQLATLRPIAPVQWNSKPAVKCSQPAKKLAPSFKLVSTGKDGAAAKSLVLNNVTGKLEEILSSLVKQQQQGPIPQNSEATAQQQETLQQLLTAISNLQAKENVEADSCIHAASALTFSGSCSKPDANYEQAAKQVKKNLPAPSSLSLIHEIKQNISRKKSSETSSPCFDPPPSTSTHNLQNEKPKKSIIDLQPQASEILEKQSIAAELSTPENSKLGSGHQISSISEERKISHPISASNENNKRVNQIVVQEANSDKRMCSAQKSTNLEKKYPLPSSLSKAEEQCTPAASEEALIFTDAVNKVDSVVAAEPALEPVSETPSPQHIPVLITSKMSPVTYDPSRDCALDYLVSDYLNINNVLAEVQAVESVAPELSVQEDDRTSSIQGQCDRTSVPAPVIEQRETAIVSQETTIIEKDNDLKTTALTEDKAHTDQLASDETSHSATVKDLEDGEITASDAEENTAADENVHAAVDGQTNSNSKSTNQVQPISDEGVVDSEDCTEVTHVSRAAVHQTSLFGAQQNRGLKFTTEVRCKLESEVFSDTLSLNGDEIAPRAYDSDESSHASHKRDRRKKRKHRHKKHKKKHHRHYHHHKKDRKRCKYEEEDSFSDCSSERERSWRRRKRRISEDTYSSARMSSPEYERSRSPVAEKRRKYSRESHSPYRRRKSYSNDSRSRSRSPRRSWKNERRCYDDYYPRYRQRDSSSPRPSVERLENSRKSSYYEWDYISQRRLDNREMKDKAIKERRVMYVGRIADTATKFFLRQRFRKFGQIDSVELYFRRLKDSYAFVTFHRTKDAYNAIEHGNEGETEIFDLCFGGRRQFCQMKYADLDEEGNNRVEEDQEEDDFDTLLRKAMKR